MMVVSAEKAREKAEARRLRILAKANERLDVVSGLVPSSDVTKVLADTSSSPVVVESPSDSPRAEDSNNVINVGNETLNVTSSSPTYSSRDEKENKGSRRMAAMRKRRAQARAAKEREDESTATAAAGGDVQSKVATTDAVEGSAADVKIGMNESTYVDTPVEETTLAKPEEVASSKVSDNKTKIVEDAICEVKAIDEPKTDLKKIDASQSSTVPSTGSSETSTTKTTTEEEQPKKSYVGVAKMRRRILKQQKAQRLQSITDSEAMQSDAQMERELVAEVAAMGVTAKMVREGVDVCDTSIIGGSITGGNIKKRKKSWLALLLPPIHTFSRIITTVVLFGTGLRLGMETHTVGVVGGESSIPTAGSSGGMIHHVESTLTKPWEYGMGGKMAYMVGTMPTAPPTALPTRFHDDTSCLSNHNEDKSECAATETKSKQSKKKDKEDHKINMIDMEDEFDTGRVRPRGVTSEFEESIPKVTNIDPVFRADLDELLSQSALPFPIDRAAKFAIGFHRMWVYYLWTMPKKLLDGWIRYPPVVLIFTLLIRAGNKVLLGGGKKLDEDGAKDNNKGGFDVMKKVMDSAKSYIEGSFPWLVFILGTLYDVVKVDMYVVFCGLLVGLVTPLNGLGWSLGFGEGHVLGDGEL